MQEGEAPCDKVGSGIDLALGEEKASPDPCAAVRRAMQPWYRYSMRTQTVHLTIHGQVAP